MQIKLFKKPKSPTIIEGFPGFGLVGTIATEYLIDHLQTELIGKVWFDDIPAMVAIHENKLVEPIGIFYNKKYNILIVHGITALTGIEWKLADILIKIATDLNAKEIISLEGVGSAMPSDDVKVYYYSSSKDAIKKLENMGVNSLNEGIIMGVTGAVLLRNEKIKSTCIFAETHSQLPDSKAAAKVIEILDKYLNLKVDYKPLLQQAEKFEKKLKGLIESSQAASSEQVKKKLSYVG